MPFSLYKRLDLEKLISTDISLQMADKSTTIPIGICENVIRPFCITILYHNLLLFIDIFHI
jgi:hypothetical protein